NRRHSACKADALPAELITRLHLRGREIYAGGEAKSIAGLEFFSKTGFSCKLQAPRKSRIT
ncbi:MULTISPECIES: hypothetical protein, partial [unclassified Pseudomonas]|uniref:hypothetical protein n=1 Tax=unclassified Pseudomonas TaxID=196821 RepID=UPI0019D614BD